MSPASFRYASALLLVLVPTVVSAEMAPAFGIAYGANKLSISYIAVADMNRDGRAEIITQDAIYARNPSANYLQIADLSIAHATISLPVDLNSDGNKDLAVIESNTLRTLISNGWGAYSPATTVTVPLYSKLAAGDFDEDGWPDVVVVNSETRVYFGSGDGRFRESQLVPFGAGLAAAVADFNGDGHMDIAVANGGWSDSYLGLDFGDGHGGFQARREAQVVGGATDIRVGDLNGDHAPDIVFQGQSAPSVLLNLGQGTFGAPHLYRNGIARCADFNGDGTDDLVIGTNGISIFVGGSEWTLRSPGSVRGFDVGDLDGDGKVDLAMHGDGWLYTCLGNGDGTVGSPDYHGTGVVESNYAAFGDFDANGFTDIASVAYNKVQVDMGFAGGFSHGWSTLLSPADNAYRIQCGDLNGDGRADLAIAVSRSCGGNHCYKQVLQLWRAIPGGFEKFVDMELSRPWMLVGDVTRDGVADVVCSLVDPVSRYSTLCVLPGTPWGMSSPIPNPFEFANDLLALGDFNGDSLPDLALDESYCLGLPEGHFAAPVPYPGVTIHFDQALIRDLDGDGTNEFIGARNLHVEILKGLGSSTSPATTVLGQAIKGPIAVADINGDGFMDLASGSSTTSLFLSGPGGALYFDRYYGGFGEGLDYHPLALTDVDGDGRADLLTRAGWGRNIWRQGDRTPPVVKVESPNGGSFDIGSPMTISWSSSDSEGIAGVELVLSAGLDPGTAIKARIATGLPATGSLSWTPQLAHKGTGWIRAIARDVAGNQSTDVSDQPVEFVIPKVNVTLDSLRAAIMPRGIRVTWGLSPRSQITSVVLLRCEGDPCGAPSVLSDQLLAQDHYDDRSVRPGVSYTYVVDANTSGAMHRAGSVSVTFSDTTSSDTTSNHPPSPLPGPLSLSAAPTPFSAQTSIAFELPATSFVRLAVLDIHGRVVTVLDEGERYAGPHSVPFSAGSASAPPGVYFVRLNTRFGSRTTRVVLLP